MNKTLAIRHYIYDGSFDYAVFYFDDIKDVLEPIITKEMKIKPRASGLSLKEACHYIQRHQEDYGS